MVAPLTWLRWICGWHNCDICKGRALLGCSECTDSFCLKDLPAANCILAAEAVRDRAVKEKALPRDHESDDEGDEGGLYDAFLSWVRPASGSKAAASARALLQEHAELLRSFPVTYVCRSCQEFLQESSGHQSRGDRYDVPVDVQRDVVVRGATVSYHRVW